MTEQENKENLEAIGALVKWGGDVYRTGYSRGVKHAFIGLTTGVTLGAIGLVVYEYFRSKKDKNPKKEEE